MPPKNKKHTKKEPTKAVPPPQKQPKRSFLKKLIMWGLTLTIWVSIGLAGILAFYAYDLPDVDVATSVERRPGITVLANNGQVLSSGGDLYGHAVQVSELPNSLIQAVLATEDRRFYDHFGFDIIGFSRALVTNIAAGRLRQGGSTLTQQVAKNLFLTPERSIKRKAQELLLALWLEHQFSKDQILTLYLNRVYLGAGTYGVEAAAQKYFQKSARHLSLYESALIAGLLKAPSRYNPAASPKNSAERTAVVLQNMVNAGYINQAQAKQAQANKQRVIQSARPHKIGQHFADWVMGQVDDYTGPIQGDVVVHTTLDFDLQKEAELQVRRLLNQHSKKRNVTQAAVIAMTPEGAITTMVGGYNYARSQFNRATQAQRQPGSAFKPFVYLAGLEAGLAPDDLMRDEPFAIGDWQPRNYTGQYQGDVTLSHALAQSINTVAVKVARHAGVPKVAAAAQRLGITSPLNNHPSLALGTSEVSLLELTAAYAPFANGGFGTFPHAITHITDSQGNILYQRQGGGSGRIIDPKPLGQINRMMQEVINQGTGKNVNFDWPLAGKSGTSQDFRDAWFVGYSHDVVLGVWMGNDNERPMKNVSGGSLPATLWGTLMRYAHQGAVPKPLIGTEEPEPLRGVKSFFQRLFGGD